MVANKIYIYVVSNQLVHNGTPSCLLSFKLNFNSTTCGHSLFTKFRDSDAIVLLVYVDDITIVGNNIKEISNITKLFDD